MKDRLLQSNPVLEVRRTRGRSSVHWAEFVEVLSLKNKDTAMQCLMSRAVRHFRCFLDFIYV